MKKSLKRLILASILLLGASAAAQAEGVPTKVLVRAVARDAKLIGSEVGGTRITLSDARTGKILAEGIQHGGSGDTQRIMVDPQPRFASVFGTPGAASYLATVELDRPTVVEISAQAPLGDPEYTYRASKTMLLVPGQDVLGEGVILEIHGFTVKLLRPTRQEVRLGSEMEVPVNVIMV